MAIIREALMDEALMEKFARRAARDDKFWMLVALIQDQGNEEKRLPAEKFEAMVCAHYPTTADIAPVLEQLRTRWRSARTP